MPINVSDTQESHRAGIHVVWPDTSPITQISSDRLQESQHQSLVAAIKSQNPIIRPSVQGLKARNSTHPSRDANRSTSPEMLERFHTALATLTSSSPKGKQEGLRGESVKSMEMAINSPSSDLIKAHFSTQFKSISAANRHQEDWSLLKTVESVTELAFIYYPPGCYLSAVQLRRHFLQLMDCCSLWLEDTHHYKGCTPATRRPADPSLYI